MLTPRLTDCGECSDILDMLGFIECRLATLSGDMYNSVTLMLNNSPSPDTLFRLLCYKRILQCRYMNPNYAGSFSVNQIADKVKILKFRR